MLKTITIENVDENKWLEFKASCILKNQTIQLGFDEMLEETLKKRRRK